MPAPVLLYGAQGQLLSSAPVQADNMVGPGAPLRSSGRGELIVENIWNGMQTLAMEGSYFIASTATPGTGIVLSVATGTTFADTQAFLAMNNTDLAGPQAKSIYLDFVAIICTTAPTNTTVQNVAHRIDSALRGVAGTQLGATGVAPRPSNMGVGTAPVGQAFALGASAVSVAASANVRNAGRNTLRAAAQPAWVVGDAIVIKFGSAEMSGGGSSIGATTASVITVYAPPLVIGPQQSYVLNEWATGRTAALSGEMVVGWVER